MCAKPNGTAIRNKQGEQKVEREIAKENKKSRNLSTIINIYRIDAHSSEKLS